MIDNLNVAGSNSGAAVLYYDAWTTNTTTIAGDIYALLAVVDEHGDEFAHLSRTAQKTEALDKRVRRPVYTQQHTVHENQIVASRIQLLSRQQRHVCTTNSSITSFWNVDSAIE